MIGLLSTMLVWTVECIWTNKTTKRWLLACAWYAELQQKRIVSLHQWVIGQNKNNIVLMPLGCIVCISHHILAQSNQITICNSGNMFVFGSLETSWIWFLPFNTEFPSTNWPEFGFGSIKSLGIHTAPSPGDRKKIQPRNRE